VVSINPPPGIEIDGAFLTCVPALLAKDAVIGRDGDLDACILCFRIVAEAAAQRASLEEDHTPDSGTILVGATLDFYDERRITQQCTSY
jgi:hypothetical protein